MLGVGYFSVDPPFFSVFLDVSSLVFKDLGCVLRSVLCGVPHSGAHRSLFDLRLHCESTGVRDGLHDGSGLVRCCPSRHFGCTVLSQTSVATAAKRAGVVRFNPVFQPAVRRLRL